MTALLSQEKRLEDKKMHMRKKIKWVTLGGRIMRIPFMVYWNNVYVLGRKEIFINTVEQP